MECQKLRCHIPWLVFSDDIGSMYHGLYGLTFVDELRRVPLDGTPYHMPGLFMGLEALDTERRLHERTRD